MADNPYPPPELNGHSEESDRSGQSTLLSCLTTSFVGGVLMALLVWAAQEFGLIVMAFVIPFLIRLHFMYACNVPSRDVPRFVLLPIVAAISALWVWSVLEFSGISKGEVLPLTLGKAISTGAIGAAAAIAFEMAIAFYNKQRHRPVQLLVLAVLTFLLLAGCDLCVVFLNKRYGWNSAAGPFIPEYVHLASVFAIWMWFSILHSTLAAGAKIRHQNKATPSQEDTGS